VPASWFTVNGSLRKKAPGRDEENEGDSGIQEEVDALKRK